MAEAANLGSEETASAVIMHENSRVKAVKEATRNEEFYKRVKALNGFRFLDCVPSIKYTGEHRMQVLLLINAKSIEQLKARRHT